MRWVYRYQSEKSVSRHNRSPVSYKIKQEHVTVILDEIKKNKTITIEDLLALLHHKFPDLYLSRRHLARIVHDNMAINTEGVLGWELYEKGGIDTDRLIEFLEKFITTKYKNKLIIFR